MRFILKDLNLSNIKTFDIISDKLDIKKILIQIHNFDLNIKCLFKKLKLQLLYENKFKMIEKWKGEYENNQHAKKEMEFKNKITILVQEKYQIKEEKDNH